MVSGRTTARDLEMLKQRLDGNKYLYIALTYDLTGEGVRRAILRILVELRAFVENTGLPVSKHFHAKDCRVAKQYWLRVIAQYQKSL